MIAATFNVRIDVPIDAAHPWKERHLRIARFLNASDWDLLGLQEATPKMLSELMEWTPRYRFVGVPRQGEDEMSPILYDFRKLNLLASGTFWLSDTPDVVSKWADSFFYRICTWAEFVPKDGKPFRIFNTHLDYAGSSVQIRQMQVLLGKMAQLDRKKPLPVLLSGDFNAEPDRPVHDLIRRQRLAKGRRLISVYDGDCRSGLTFHDYHGNGPGFPIDFLYHTPDWKRVSGGIITEGAETREFLSDHFPVFLRLE